MCEIAPKNGPLNSKNTWGKQGEPSCTTDGSSFEPKRDGLRKFAEGKQTQPSKAKGRESKVLGETEKDKRQRPAGDI